MSELSPAFQFYPDDWLSSASVTLLSRSQEGDYIRLLCYCWREGSIPNDAAKLATLVGKGATEQEMAQLLNLFEIDKKDSTRLIHSRLDRERKKQKKHRKERSLSGAKGAKSRWRKDKQQENSDGSAIGSANGSAINQPMAKNGSSSPSSSSSSSTENTHTVRRVNFAIPASEEEAVEFAGKAGVAPDFARSLYHQCEGRGWLDGSGQQIQMWSNYAKGRYLKEAFNKPPAAKGAAKAIFPSDIKLAIQNKEKEAEAFKRKHFREHQGLSGGQYLPAGWDSEQSKAEHAKLKAEAQALKDKFNQMAA
jgi:uncharacterized protein YdaU (DUF1376 family)